MNRPFALSVLPNAHQRELVVNLALARSPDDQALIGIADVLKAFQGLAEWGGLAVLLQRLNGGAGGPLWHWQPGSGGQTSLIWQRAYAGDTVKTGVQCR
jgi:hypothetical protein